MKTRLAVLIYFMSIPTTAHAASSDNHAEIVPSDIPTAIKHGAEKSDRPAEGYSRSDFTLEGIVYDSAPEGRSAVLRLAGSLTVKVYSIGDAIGPFTLSAIERDGVTLYHEKRILQLRLERFEVKYEGEQ